MIRAPFPWFGGKSRAASTIWAALGAVDNYVEPFFGSGAVLLAADAAPRVVTVNDADGHLCNVWRALAADPDAVAEHAVWPVNECDLSARHLWLVQQRAALTARLQTDPEYYDAKAAGWWIWGACAWIGSGWCSGDGPWTSADGGWVNLGNAGQGINRKLPHLGDAGQGINRQLPHLGDAGQGINRQLPHLGDAGRGIAIVAWFREIAAKLSGVRVCCGDWSRVVTDSVTHRHGLTGVLLDPPYPDGWDPDAAYSGSAGSADALWRDVVAWAEEAGRHPKMRVVVCGYDGAGEPPVGWRSVTWTARKGYQTDADAVRRERLWLSPGCLSLGGVGAVQLGLGLGGAA